MKNKVFRACLTGVFALIASSMALVLVGCGNDEAPPDDPSYYKGPMAPKSGAAGPQTDTGTQ